jgi:peptide-methionine (S)-S-oxide reductase
MGSFPIRVAPEVHMMIAAKIRSLSLPLLAVALIAVVGFWLPSLQAAEQPVVIPAPSFDNPKAKGNLQTAVFAGGCFWGVQGVFEHVRGVRKAVSGYAGGDRTQASYEIVSSGTTGHAESVQVTFDPAEVSYGELLQVFFSVAHDPTQLDRQGPDTGTQYRSEIFYGDAGQKKVADAYIAQLDKTKAYPRPIVTRVESLKGFYAAEGYHQDFLINHPTHGYIVNNDLPKIANLKKIFPAQYSDQPVTVNAIASR